MAIVLVDNGSKYTSALLKILHHDKPTVISYEDLDYRNFSKGDIVILTGGHGSPILWHKKQYAKETELVRRHKGPVIGICLGFELIAHIYGSHLHLLNDRRRGEVMLTANSRASFKVPASVRVYENHNWSVPTVRWPLVSIARSEDGVEVLKHSRKPIYGLQFHPEESSMGGMEVFSLILEKLRQ